MKISFDSTSRMVLKDHNITSFFGGLAFTIVGLVIVTYSFSSGWYTSSSKSPDPMGTLFGILFGAIFTIVGLYLLVTTKIITATLDKTADKGAFSFQGLLKRESKEIELSDIKELVLQKFITTSSPSKGGSRTYFNYILMFALKSGDEIPLEFGKVTSGLMDVLASPDENKKKEAQQVADFVGVSMRFVGPPSITDAFSAIKEGIAEGMVRYGKKQP